MKIQGLPYSMQRAPGLHRSYERALTEAIRADTAWREDMLRYAIDLSTRNHAPVQLFLPWPDGDRMDFYEIPADCQALREVLFAMDQDYPRDAPP